MSFHVDGSKDGLYYERAALSIKFKMNIYFARYFVPIALRARDDDPSISPPPLLFALQWWILAWPLAILPQLLVSSPKL